MLDRLRRSKKIIITAEIHLSTMVFTSTPLFAIPAGPEVLAILFIAVLLFGANKIPKLARSTGQAMGEFRRGRQQVEEELQEMEEEVSADVENEEFSNDEFESDSLGTDDEYTDLDSEKSS